MNTPLAVSEMHRLANLVYDDDELSASILLSTGKFLGLFSKSSEEWFRPNDIEIEELIKKRTYYRNMKDFSSADSIRNSLLNQNIILEDLPNTTIWRKL